MTGTRQLEAGMPAPDFDMPVTGGGTARLADYAGRHLVLYFYPRDDTPGCTTEAQDFSARADAFAESGAAILGVSRDSLARHERFAAKHGLAIPLASDEDGTVCEAYGVWVEKRLYGKTHMGIERTTFLISGDGAVEKVWRKVKVKGHAESVLECVAKSA